MKFKKILKIIINQINEEMDGKKSRNHQLLQVDYNCNPLLFHNIAWIRKLEKKKKAKSLKIYNSSWIIQYLKKIQYTLIYALTLENISFYHFF